MHILDKVIITKYNTNELLYKKECHKKFDNRLKLNAYRLRLYRFAKHLYNAEVTVTFSMRTIEKVLPFEQIAEIAKKTGIKALDSKNKEVYLRYFKDTFMQTESDFEKSDCFNCGYFPCLLQKEQTEKTYLKAGICGDKNEAVLTNEVK